MTAVISQFHVCCELSGAADSVGAGLIDKTWNHLLPNGVLRQSANGNNGRPILAAGDVFMHTDESMSKPSEDATLNALQVTATRPLKTFLDLNEIVLGLCRALAQERARTDVFALIFVTKRASLLVVQPKAQKVKFKTRTQFPLTRALCVRRIGAGMARRQQVVLQWKCAMK